MDWHLLDWYYSLYNEQLPVELSTQQFSQWQRELPCQKIFFLNLLHIQRFWKTTMRPKIHLCRSANFLSISSCFSTFGISSRRHLHDCNSLFRDSTCISRSASCPRAASALSALNLSLSSFSLRRQTFVCACLTFRASATSASYTKQQISPNWSFIIMLDTSSNHTQHNSGTKSAIPQIFIIFYDSLDQARKRNYTYYVTSDIFIRLFLVRGLTKGINLSVYYKTKLMTQPVDTRSRAERRH
jgi:hypothetical protein